jgi:hypothetical protein
MAIVEGPNLQGAQFEIMGLGRDITKDELRVLAKFEVVEVRSIGD